MNTTIQIKRGGLAPSYPNLQRKLVKQRAVLLGINTAT